MMAMIIMIVMIHDNDDEKIRWGFLWLTPRYTVIIIIGITPCLPDTFWCLEPVLHCQY